MQNKIDRQNVWNVFFESVNLDLKIEFLPFH